ncbi:gHMP kinase N-terminal domain protein [Ruminococcus sp. CAG:379]|nr:gHMP kinase N-terminal domain protein [Ruminococcus sp. CAG:379]
MLAAGVSLDVIAAAAPNGTNLIRVKSEGYPEDLIDLSQRIPMPEETNTAAALIRGVAARFIQLGYPVSGFDAYTTSSVLKGSGLSSSAAFEVLLGNIINAFFADGAETPVSIAQIGQYAENVFFGKPCGLMDQMACSLGNVASIDFADPDNPGIRQMSLDLQKAGYALCIIDSGGDHADLTACYAAVPAEMRSIARQFGKQVLRQVPQAEFEAAIPALRKACGDRAVLRAMHFYGENARVMEQTAALEQGNILRFLSLVTESGRSSETLLQNIFDCRNPRQQPISMALASRSAWRWRCVDSCCTVKAHAGSTVAALPAQSRHLCRWIGSAPSAAVWKPYWVPAHATCCKFVPQEACNWNNTTERSAVPCAAMKP